MYIIVTNTIYYIRDILGDFSHNRIVKCQNEYEEVLFSANCIIIENGAMVPLFVDFGFGEWGQ